jgi:FAD-dependent sensor of blue light
MIRLIYVSQTDNITFENNKDILTSSFKYNQEKQISGALVYGLGFFIQCLEGDEETVHALYEKISQDTRHYNVKTVSEEPVDERHFPQWHMSLMNLSAYKSITDKTDFNPYEMTGDQLLALIDQVSMIV